MSPSMSLVRSKHGAAVVLLPFLLLLGCKDASQGGTGALRPRPRILPRSTPKSGPRRSGRSRGTPRLEEKVAALLKKMTVEEKVGQVVQGDICCVTPEDMKKYHLGSVLNGGDSAPGDDERAPAKKWLEAGRCSSTPPRSTPATAASASR